LSLATVPLAEESTRPCAQPGILSWVAVAGESDRDEPLDRLPERRTVVAGSESSGGLQVLGVAGLPLPPSAAVGPCGVVFEGELYAREELRLLLEVAGESGVSDAKLVARAYLRWGEGMLSRLKGLFAFVVWDSRSQRVLGARDRLGIFPLFESFAGKTRLFATSPDLLTLHPRVSRRLHRAVLAERLISRYFDARDTSYEAIRQIPPGHLLVGGAGSEGEPRRYWTPVVGEREAANRAEVGERFDALLGQAVERCLSRGPAAIYLSGGLDSINVATIAADCCLRTGGAPPDALSLLFPGEISEETVQRSVAARLGMRHELLAFETAAGGNRLVSEVTRTSARFPAPLESLWKVAYLRLGELAVRRDRRAIVTGAGGDEWLDVGINVAADLMRRLELGELFELWRTLRRSYRAPQRLILQNLLWKYGLRPVLAGVVSDAAPWIERRRRRRYIRDSTPDWIAPDPELRRQLDERAERYLPTPQRGSQLEEVTRRSLDHPLTALTHQEQFETGRILGVPILSPLNDADLIEFLCRVPRGIMQQGRRSKGLLRERAVARFPDLGFEKQKKLASTSYFRSLLRSQAGGAWRELGGAISLADLGVVDPAGIDRAMRRRLEGPVTREVARTWFILSVEAWTRLRH
jgi:asparagine synthase (glutamine-hydrolysing)